MFITSRTLNTYFACIIGTELQQTFLLLLVLLLLLLAAAGVGLRRHQALCEQLRR
jgi:hypothetical protein